MFMHVVSYELYPRQIFLHTIKILQLVHRFVAKKSANYNYLFYLENENYNFWYLVVLWQCEESLFSFWIDEKYH